MEKQYFDEMAEQKFHILNDSKNIITSERIPVTFSIGASSVGNTLEENEKFALEWQQDMPRAESARTSGHSGGYVHGL